MSPPSGERKRAKKPKTRTGCITCKSRRVKCDEGKPACVRCIKVGRDCGGYQDVYQATDERAIGRHQFKISIPAHQNQRVLRPLATVAAFSSPFQDPGQNRYFLYFQEETIPEVFGTFDEALFGHVVLQACYTEPALMRLIAAIGAVDKSFRVQHINRNASEASMHRHQALLSYGLALRGIQKMVSTPTAYTPRIILLAALLIFCFQNLLGDVKAARGHITSALHLLHKQLAQRSTTHRYTQNSTNPDLVEDSIIAVFARLDNGIITQPDILFEGLIRKKKNPQNPRGGILKITYTPGDAMPSEFEHIFEARIYLEVVQFHFIPLMVQGLPEIANDQTFKNRVPLTDTTIYDTAMRHLQQWNSAFQPLYIKSTLPTATGRQNPLYTGGETMRARAMATRIAFQSLLPTNISLRRDSCNRLSEDLAHNCREVLRLSRRLAAEPGYSRYFVLDCMIVPAVFMAIVAPVELSIKREALEVMRSLVPRREATWDSAALLEVGEAHLKACVGELSLRR